MLKLNLNSLNALQKNASLKNKVIIYWQEPEIYSTDDKLLSISSLNTSISSEGSYEIANATIELKNEDYYFSKRLSRELPNNKLVEIYRIISDSEEILEFRGIVPRDGGWSLNDNILTLNINS